MSKAHLTFLLTDSDPEDERTVTALRILHGALARGYDVHVFAGRRALAAAPSNDGSAATEEWLGLLRALAAEKGASFDWIRCGPDGYGEVEAGPWRGTTVDVWSTAELSTNSLAIGAR